MKNFIDYLINEKIIDTLTNVYRINEIKEIDTSIINHIICNLTSEDFSKKKLYLSHLEYDFLGKLYENIKDKEERKILGEFYTPQPIVNYILNAVGYKYDNNIENKKIIDISCGSGSFIIQCIKILINFYLDLLKKSNIFDLSLDELKIIINSVKNNIFGIDINPLACILCQINIYFVLFEFLIRIRLIEKDYELPIFNIYNDNTLLFKPKLSYDFVVGNPPYIFIRDISKEQRIIIDDLNLATNKGQYDYYQLFMEIGTKLLKEQGNLGYIVPDSLLALSNRGILRKYLYQTTEIKEIFHIGSRFDDAVVSNIIIILKKEKNKQNRENNTIKSISGSNQKSKEIIIPQNMVKKWNYKFLINLNNKDREILDHLNNNFIKLKDLNKKNGFEIKINRGVELTKTGEIVFCKLCGQSLPVPKNLICPKCKSRLNSAKIETIIHKNVPNDRKNDFKKFIYAIDRYQVKKIRYIDTSKSGINYKNQNLYEKRIVIRQMSQNKLLCATYIDFLALASQSFYNLKIINSSIQEFNHFYLLGLINSQLLSYYFIKSFGSYKKLFPRILIEKIKRFPIKIPKTINDKKIASEIVMIVKDILKNKDLFKNYLRELQKKIDLRVYELYNIMKKEQEYIAEILSQN